MPIQTSAAGGAGAVALSNSVRTQYLDQYAEEVYFSRYYDQLAIPMGRDMAELIRGSAVQANFISKMAIGTSAISETADITPQALRDAVATITPTSRGEAIQTSQQIQIRNFLNDYMEKLVKTVAEGAAETIDVLARDAATQGTLVNRTAARASPVLLVQQLPSSGKARTVACGSHTLRPTRYGTQIASIWSCSVAPALC